MNIQDKRNAVRKFVNEIGEHFYSVTYVKKTDGSIRKMNCRQNVAKYSNGGVNPCAGKDDLLPTYSVDSEGYRTIWIDGIKEIRGNGKVIRFD